MHRRIFLSTLVALTRPSTTARAMSAVCDSRFGCPPNARSSIKLTKRLGRIVLEDGTTYEDFNDGAGFVITWAPLPSPNAPQVL